MRYYNYDHLIYKASQTSPTSISSPANSQTELNNTYWYTLDGKPLPTRPRRRGYISIKAKSAIWMLPNKK